MKKKKKNWKSASGLALKIELQKRFSKNRSKMTILQFIFKIILYISFLFFFFFKFFGYFGRFWTFVGCKTQKSPLGPCMLKKYLNIWKTLAKITGISNDVFMFDVGNQSVNLSYWISIASPTTSIAPQTAPRIQNVKTISKVWLEMSSSTFFNLLRNLDGLVKY